MFKNRNKIGVIIGAVIIAAIGGSYLYFRSLSIPTSELLLKMRSLGIENLARSNNVPFENKNIAGKKISEYKNTEVTLAYGWLDDKSLAITLGDKPDKIFSLKTSDSIAKDKNFQRSIENFPKQNNGYYYLNFKELNSFIYSSFATFSQPVPPETKAILDSFISIAGVSSMPDSSTLVQELLIELQTSDSN